MLTLSTMWRAALVWLLSTSGIPAPETIDGALAIEHRGDDAGAVAALERLIGYRPAFALARLEAARLYLKTENSLTRAEGHLEAARALIPEDARTHYLWALVMEGRGRPDETIRALDLAVRLRPDFAEARSKLGAAYAGRSDWPQAESQFRALAQQQPESIQAKLQLAEVLARQSRWQEAEEELSAALRVQPRSPLLASRLAEVYERSGRNREANALRAAIIAGVAGSAGPAGAGSGSASRKLRPLPKSRR